MNSWLQKNHWSAVVFSFHAMQHWAWWINLMNKFENRSIADTIPAWFCAVGFCLSRKSCTCWPLLKRNVRLPAPCTGWAATFPAESQGDDADLNHHLYASSREVFHSSRALSAWPFARSSWLALIHHSEQFNVSSTKETAVKQRYSFNYAED